MPRAIGIVKNHSSVRLAEIALTLDGVEHVVVVEKGVTEGFYLLDIARKGDRVEVEFETRVHVTQVTSRAFPK